MVAPLDRTSAHTCRWWDTDRCSRELAFLWCQSDTHLSLGRLKGIRDPSLQTPRDNTFCRCSFSDGVGQSECLNGFILLSLVPLSQRQDQIYPIRLTRTNLAVCGRVIHKVLQKVTSWCFLDNCCYMRTQWVGDAGPILDHRSEHKHGAYPRWFDWLIQFARPSGDDRLNCRWDGCPNSDVVVPKTVPQRLTLCQR
jgi:hypothetical protein